MPTFIIKPTREDDFYIAYSTVVDGVFSWGSRTAFEMFSRRDARVLLGCEVEDIPARLDRADAQGTSDMVDLYPFDSGPLIVRWSADGNEEVGAHLIDRADVWKWLEGADDTLLRPITYEDDR